MKRLIFLLLLFALLCISIVASAEMFTIHTCYSNDDYQAYLDNQEKYKYEITTWSGSAGDYVTIEAPIIVSGDFAYSMLPNGEATITGVFAERKIIEIPSVIDGIPVTQIAGRLHPELTHASAIIYESPVEKLIIPDSVTYIGPYFVRGCYDLKEVILPDTLQYIGYQAFCNTWATTTKVPAQMEHIGPEAFFWMHITEKNFVLSPNVSSIGRNAFDARDFKSITIPGSVRTIDEEAFNNTGNVQTIILEEGLEALGKSIFKSSSRLGSITFPASLKVISDFAFDDCSKLKTVKFANSSNIQEIGQGAFSNCISLKSIVLPEGLSVISGEAFYGCKELASITIPGSVTSIGDYAFEGCSKNLRLTVVEGSYAHNWAQENGIKTKTVKAPNAAKSSQNTSVAAEIEDGTYKTLKPGSKGQAVLDARMKLYELGYFNKKPTQKEYTNNMKDYVKKFEKDYDLKQDGILSPEDQEVLFSL